MREVFKFIMKCFLLSFVIILFGTIYTNVHANEVRHYTSIFKGRGQVLIQNKPYFKFTQYDAIQEPSYLDIEDVSIDRRVVFKNMLMGIDYPIERYGVFVDYPITLINVYFEGEEGLKRRDYTCGPVLDNHSLNPLSLPYTGYLCFGHGEYLGPHYQYYALEVNGGLLNWDDDFLNQLYVEDACVVTGSKDVGCPTPIETYKGKVSKLNLSPINRQNQRKSL